ncbi:MAG: hypothetical protein LBG86_00040 [Puniceicoccales bacterium]|jgi:hypothetical protein|nr:hypothetical protein [Puniceicoccales bacterium]
MGKDSSPISQDGRQNIYPDYGCPDEKPTRSLVTEIVTFSAITFVGIVLFSLIFSLMPVFATISGAICAAIFLWTPASIGLYFIQKCLMSSESSGQKQYIDMQRTEDDFFKAENEEEEQLFGE